MLYKDTNQIKKNYYLNLFSANAEIKKSPYSILSASGASTGGNGNQNQNQNGGGGNGNQNQNQNQGGGTGNNYIYNWNIRDLQLGKYAEIALVQIANNKADYTEERQYPPKLFNTSTNEITSSNDIFNIAPVPYYKQTITLNTDDITYGSGTYEIYSSSMYPHPTLASQIKKLLLFDYNNDDAIGAHWDNNNYTNGVYNKSNFIVSGYTGDWIILKLPNPIILTKFSFSQRIAAPARAPAEWKCYGSSDGITFTEITQASNDINSLKTTDYANNIYEKTLTNFNTPYIYIGFTFKKLLGIDIVLNFNELRLFGREKITRIKQRLTEEREYPPKAYNTFTNEITTTGELSNILPTTFYKQNITLNTTGISYGSGDYIIYSSSSLLNEIFTKKFLFNYITNDGDAHFSGGQYSNPDGTYNGANYIVNGYKGDWIIVKLPNPIILTRFRFYARPGFNTRSPALWKCYGSNDGITFTEITQASNDIPSNASTTTNYPTNAPNNYYEKTLTNFNIPYLYIGWTINEVVGGTNFGDILNFAEIRLFGKEEIKYLTEEREYPPKEPNIITASSSSTGEILNVVPLTHIKESVLLNTDTISYGSGRYNIYSSSATSDRVKSRLLNKIYNDLAGWAFNYVNGVYNHNHNIKTNYLGEWFIIELPIPIILTRFRFYIAGSFTGRVPALWRCYGSNDGINFTEINQASNDVNLLTTTNYSPNNYYEHISPNINIAYKYIGFTIQRLVGIDTTLHIGEVVLYGKEVVPDKNIYTIKTQNSYNDGYDSTSTTNAMLYMNNELVSTKTPTYHKLNTYNLNRITLEINDDIEGLTNNGIDPNIEFGAIFHIREYNQ
jgi:hypothetical protein